MDIVTDAATRLAHVRRQLVAPGGVSAADLAASIRASVAPLRQATSAPFGPMDVFVTYRIPYAVDLAEQAATLVLARERPFAATDVAAPIASIGKAIDLLTAPGAHAIQSPVASPFGDL